MSGGLVCWENKANLAGRAKLGLVETPFLNGWRYACVTFHDSLFFTGVDDDR